MTIGVSEWLRSKLLPKLEKNDTFSLASFIFGDRHVIRRGTIELDQNLIIGDRIMVVQRVLVPFI